MTDPSSSPQSTSRSPAAATSFAYEDNQRAQEKTASSLIGILGKLRKSSIHKLRRRRLSVSFNSAQKHKTVQFSSQASSRLQSPQSSRVHAEVPLLPLHVVEEFETLPKRRNSESHVPTLFSPDDFGTEFPTSVPKCPSLPKRCEGSQDDIDQQRSSACEYKHDIYPGGTKHRRGNSFSHLYLQIFTNKTTGSKSMRNKDF